MINDVTQARKDMNHRDKPTWAWILPICISLSLPAISLGSVLSRTLGPSELVLEAEKTGVRMTTSLLSPLFLEQIES